MFFFIILFSLACRSYYEIEYSDFYVDKAYQIAVSKNIDQGYGAHLVTLSNNDIGETKIKDIEGYTIFYSYLISILTPNISYKHAADFIDTFLVLVIIVSVIILFRNINISQKTQSIFLLFFAFVPFPFNILTSTDLLLVATFIALASLFYYIISTDEFKTLPFIILSILVGMLPFIKISAIPYMLVFPTVYFLIFLFTKDISNLRKGVIMLIISVFTLFIIFYLIEFTPKSKSSEYGFYPQQLLQLDPFIQKSLFYINDYIKNYTFYSFLKPALVILNFIFIIVFYKMFKSKKTRFNSLYLLISSSILVCILFYSLCSILFEGETWKTPHWTYVETSRYFGGAILLFQIGIFVLLEEKKWNSVFKYLFLIIFIFNGLIFSKGFYDNVLLDKNRYNYNYNYSDMILRSDFISSIDTEKKKLYANLNKKSGFDENFVYIHSDIFHYIECDNINEINLLNTNNSLFLNINISEKDKLINHLKENNCKIKFMKEINDEIIILVNSTR